MRIRESNLNRGRQQNHPFESQNLRVERMQLDSKLPFVSILFDPTNRIEWEEFFKLK